MGVWCFFNLVFPFYPQGFHNVPTALCYWYDKKVRLFSLLINILLMFCKSCKINNNANIYCCVCPPSLRGSALFSFGATTREGSTWCGFWTHPRACLRISPVKTLHPRGSICRYALSLSLSLSLLLIRFTFKYAFIIIQPLSFRASVFSPMAVNPLI